MKKIIPVLISLILVFYIGYLSYGLISKSSVPEEKNAPDSKIKRAPAGSGKPADSPVQAETPAASSQTVRPSVLTTAEVAASGAEAPAQVKKILPPPQPVKDVDIKKFKYAAVKGMAVNVRSESRIAPNNVIEKVNNGDVFDIISIEKPASDNHKWIKVRLKSGAMGFIRDDLVELREKK